MGTRSDEFRKNRLKEKEKDKPSFADRFKEKADRFKEKVKKTKEKAKEKVRETKEQAQQGIKDATNKAKAKVRETKEQAQQGIKDATNKVTEKAIEAEEQLKAFKDKHTQKSEEPRSDAAADEAGDKPLELKQKPGFFPTKLVEVVKGGVEAIKEKVQEKAGAFIKEAEIAIGVASKDFDLKSAETLLNGLEDKEKAFWYSAVIKELYTQMNMSPPEMMKAKDIDYDALTNQVSKDIDKYIQIQKDPNSPNVGKLTEFLGLAKEKLLKDNTADRIKLIAKGVTCAVAATAVTLFAAATVATVVSTVGSAAAAAVSIYVAASTLAYAIDPKAHREFVMKYSLPHLYDLNFKEKVDDLASDLSTGYLAINIGKQVKDSLKAASEGILNILDSWGVKSVRGFADDYNRLFGQASSIERLNEKTTPKLKT